MPDVQNQNVAEKTALSVGEGALRGAASLSALYGSPTPQAFKEAQGAVKPADSATKSLPNFSIEGGASSTSAGSSGSAHDGVGGDTAHTKPDGGANATHEVTSSAQPAKSGEALPPTGVGPTPAPESEHPSDVVNQPGVAPRIGTSSYPDGEVGRSGNEPKKQP